jgi:DNA mismatch repair protein MutH
MWLYTYASRRLKFEKPWIGELGEIWLYTYASRRPKADEPWIGETNRCGSIPMPQGGQKLKKNFGKESFERCGCISMPQGGQKTKNLG